ncbi:delta and Notch-like epidermal growth factor-related receptor isoform X2 [Zootermopsis nevadensis]|uniref:delta and Notch-like epidermal growth factor-related receptor isoform X2 n=1 Tax=Zootermopsis nevadensis TaxID=136037 RepID=UPI000B8E7D42|nr:delta and Notch-like epidermal growth factor-related receptor isoform X2 [Zootermopsis nevadensis]
MKNMSVILSFFKTLIVLSILLRTVKFSGAATVNLSRSKLVTTLKGTLTPDTTPANPPFNNQTLFSMANTDYRTSYTTQSSILSSTTESYTSTMTTVDIITTMTTKHQPQPSAHRIPSRLEEKLESLSCDIPPLPTESRLWRGNETHELMLPITVQPDCEGEDNEEAECAPVSVSWEGSAEMQSGDILLVRIDDTRLVDSTAPRRPMSVVDRRQPETAVYGVTRPGYDHCDVTEGVLLDITPLLVDGRKVVTLYDKDLAEGINLLIVVSSRWGSECVRLRIVVKSDNCGEGQDCSGKGVCFSNISMDGYECQCCPGYVGPHCEERDGCYPSPCSNSGICVDISQGHEGNTFQCLCPYGYAGKTCQEETDPCASSPCQNGGTCVRNGTQFRCDCGPGFGGTLCQHNLNECVSSPCVHGICVDQQDGYRCFCQPGFAGQHCEYEYDECESSPCVNGGTCMDHIGTFMCICGRGYTGKRCHVKVDLCDPNPCTDHHYCVDRGNNYSCECPKGFAGPDCLIPSKAACSVNPCLNGGTCWSSVNSFYCACRPGYTGKTCQEFVLEAIPKALPSNRDSQLDLQMPISIHLDHLHNVFIAAGTLACAVIIVVITVAACHCRVHETYKRCFPSAAPLLPCKVTHLEEVVKPSSSRNRSNALEVEKGSSTNRSFPSLDTTEMYYTLDFSDSQSSPLIQ